MNAVVKVFKPFPRVSFRQFCKFLFGSQSNVSRVGPSPLHWDRVQCTYVCVLPLLGRIICIRSPNLISTYTQKCTRKLTFLSPLEKSGSGAIYRRYRISRYLFIYIVTSGPVPSQLLYPTRPYGLFIELVEVFNE